MQSARFRNTERKLYNYFNMDNLLHSYINKIKKLRDKIRDIDERLKNIDISIDSDIQAISYSERVQTSNTGVGYAEKQLILKTEILINERARIDTEIVELEVQRDRIELDNIIISENIKTLRNDYIEFLTYKYKDKKSNKQIAFLMHMSDPTITRIKHQSLKTISSWENTLLFKS
ncbi:MAG: hypothetical protein ACRCWG_06570 [Sarcina sp.]